MKLHNLLLLHTIKTFIVCCWGSWLFFLPDVPRKDKVSCRPQLAEGRLCASEVSDALSLSWKQGGFSPLWELLDRTDDVNQQSSVACKTKILS